MSELHHNAFAPVCTCACICTDVYDVREPEFLPNLWPLQDCSLCAVRLADILFFAAVYSQKFTSTQVCPRANISSNDPPQKGTFFASYVVFLPFNTLNITFDVSKQRLAVFKTTYTTV